ncbi:mediator of RNA polymerase II transcription subunit 17 isoform X1 [Dermacentor andersoni]|uniref:mediator of RNA polymerase II transcription subunit 17 isoform X1 n=1 Tax=Dermacentor andersoni TaxID=34620 RepID=UPI002155C43D|nr:mediator of RNA polymerase II transcription subunit 17-like isoform X1 [Dermacentor andersoni]XP_054929164.1 mediator of RNA polymerase II transcription subunit 17-like isoform X1 [Dermacentor andersoni]
MSNSSGSGSSVAVCVEACQEYQVQEITYDGQEVYVQPCSMSENLTKLAQKIDFGQAAAVDEQQLEKASFQPSLWPWDSVRAKLRSALTEVSVLCDVLGIARQKHYLVLDPVSQEPSEHRPVAVLVAKKKALAAAAGVLLTGAECLRGAAADPGGMSSPRGSGVALSPPQQRLCPDFHAELLHMRQNWRLRKVGPSTIVGDLSYRSAGSRFWQSGTFEVSKSSEPRAGSSLQVTLPSELEGISYIQVTIQKDMETIASGQLSINLPQNAFSSPETHWQQRLEAAQNVLFCRELFAQLAREAVQLQPSIPNLVVGNQITTALFPGVQLCIGLCHRTLQDRQPALPPSRLDHKHVLEHSLHQLLREYHYAFLHQGAPRPASGPVGVPLKRHLAGPHAHDRQRLRNSLHSEAILEKIIAQTQHVALRLRTMYVIDQFACEVKDPLVVAHWACLSSPTHNSVKINILSQGYETMCRTPLVIHVEEQRLQAVCRDGRVIQLSYEPQELRFLLMAQVAQHQVSSVQTLAKFVGWKVLSTCNNVGVGPLEALGNASSILMASPTGDKMISVRCGPQSGAEVCVSCSPQQQDFYPSTLVRDRKWHNLSGAFRQVCLARMQGRSFLSKMEHLMAALTT